MRLIAVMAAAAALSLAGATAAHAGDGANDTTTVEATGGTVTVEVAMSVGGPAAVATTPVIDCWYALGVADSVTAPAPEQDRLGDLGSLPPGTAYWKRCVNLTTGALTFDGLAFHDPSRPAMTAERLAFEAREALVLPAPVPVLSPSIEATQLVGLRTWLAVQRASWAQLSASAQVPGLTATVEASPVRTTWQMGDGARVVCAGPGRVWGPEVAGTDCGHVYQVDSAEQPGGAYAASVTVEWRVVWRASDGSSGTLARIERATSFSVEVGQRQAVVVAGQASSTSSR